MNRHVAIALVCTFLALVAATVWVPLYPGQPGSDWPWDMRWDHSRYCPVWKVGTVTASVTVMGFGTVTGSGTLLWELLLATVVGIIAIGGRLAMLLRTRATRGPAEMRWDVVGVTVLAMVGAMLWVPTYHAHRGEYVPFLRSEGLHETFDGFEYRWVWERYYSLSGYHGGDYYVRWPLVFAEQALLLLLGGGLLTWVVRRERRRKAAT